MRRRLRLVRDGMEERKYGWLSTLEKIENIIIKKGRK